MSAPQASYTPELDWTATPPAPDPRLRLEPYGATSFVTNNFDLLVDWLTRVGFVQEQARSGSECVRMRRGRSLIVIYWTKTVLLQGQQVDTTHVLLSGLTGGVA